eukprot:4042320-Amphidinium_carterae.1
MASGRKVDWNTFLQFAMNYAPAKFHFYNLSPKLPTSGHIAKNGSDCTVALVPTLCYRSSQRAEVAAAKNEGVKGVDRHSE